MLQFLTRLFAVIGFLLVLLICGGITLGSYMYEQQRPKPEPKSSILVLAFDEPIIEQKDDPSPLNMALDGETVSLMDILRAIDHAKNDPHVKGIVARFGAEQPTMTQGQEIRAALAHFRESGKFTYAFGTSYGDFGEGNRAYYLASAFDNIWLQPVGTVSLTGIAMQEPFAKAALAKIGVSGQFLQREEYKSAMDTITRDSFAPQVKVETQAMIEDLAAQLADGIAESRKWTADQVRQLMENGPYTDDEALKAGLVTHIGYADELDKELDDKAGKDVPRISVSEYLSFERCKCESQGTKIAVIYGEGVIGDKADGPSAIPGEQSLGADKIADAFNDAAEAKDVKAILFRIDSPGGTPEASETIRRALMQAQKKGKPVIVSMGDMAASGGYWVAMNADRIIAEPATLTGSIGVFAGKFTIGSMMQKIGVNWETLRTTNNAGMWSMVDDFSPAQLARVNALLDGTYHTFTKNVSDARKIPMDKMPDVAKGRVWTGQQAIKIGLVDQLGGYEVALDALRETLKLDKKAPLSLEPFPPPETPLERIQKLMKNFGFESASLGPIFMEWQRMQSALGFVRHATTMQPVELLSPQAAFGVVR